MFAAILTDLPSSKTVRQLAGVGQSRGHEMVVVGSSSSHDISNDQESESASSGESYQRLDAVFPFLDRRHLTRGLAVLSECESAGVLLDVNPFPQFELWGRDTTDLAANRLFDLIEKQHGSQLNAH